MFSISLEDKSQKVFFNFPGFSSLQVILSNKSCNHEGKEKKVFSDNASAYSLSIQSFFEEKENVLELDGQNYERTRSFFSSI